MARILIADPSSDSRRILREALDFDHDFEVVDDVEDGSEIAQLIGPLSIDAVLIDVELDDGKAMELVERLRSRHRQVGIVMTGASTTVETVKRAMRAGADDYIDKPFDPHQVTDTVGALIRRVEERRVVGGGMDTSGGPVVSKVVSVYSPQGGVGKSMLAANLAVVIARESARPTALVDLNLQFGDIDLMLNITPERTIAAMIQRMNQLDADLMESFLTLHKESGLKVLAAPNRPEYADTITVFVVEKVLQVLRERYTYVIIDTPSFLQDTTLTALDHSDEILLLTALDLLALHNTKTALAMMQKLRYGPEKVKLILNRSDSDVGISPDDVEQTLDYEISAYIPSDGRVAVTSVNEGDPFVLSQQRTQITQAVRRIAYQVMDREDEFSQESGEFRRSERRRGGFVDWLMGR